MERNTGKASGSNLAFPTCWPCDSGLPSPPLYVTGSSPSKQGSRFDGLRSSFQLKIQGSMGELFHPTEMFWYMWSLSLCHWLPRVALYLALFRPHFCGKKIFFMDSEAEVGSKRERLKSQLFPELVLCPWVIVSIHPIRALEEMILKSPSISHILWFYKFVPEIV